MSTSKLECFPAALRRWLPLTQADMEGINLDITEESAAPPLYGEDNFDFESFSARS